MQEFILTRKGENKSMKNKWIVILLFLTLGACSDAPERVVYPSEDLELEKILDKQDSIIGYKSLMDDNTLLVSIEIPTMKRFSKVKIEEKIKKELENEYPNKKVIVIDDLKIKWEIEKIIEKEHESKELTKSIEKILALSKEET